MNYNEFASILNSDMSKYQSYKECDMHVEVVGSRSKKLKKLIIEAVQFYCALLMTKRMCDSLEIYVFLKKKLDNDFTGLCMYIDHHEGKRTFEIELSKGFTVRETLCSLAHEVVHMKQFAKGELKDTMVTATVSKWMGVEIDESKVDYWDLPFEIEAYGRERGLYSRFAISKGLDKEKEFLDSKVE